MKETTRYSDAELEEFKVLIEQKLAEAQEHLKLLEKLQKI